MNFSSPTDLSYIVYGSAESQFAISERKNERNRLQRKPSQEKNSYQGKEVLLYKKKFLMGQKDADIVPIKMGLTRFKFASQIPFYLPATLRGRHGSISYKVQVIMADYSDTFRAYEKSFKVFRVDDLNSDAELRVPIKAEVVKNFRRCFFPSGSLSMSVKIPFGGFVPGQMIPVTIFYDNTSSVHVEGTKVLVWRKIIYKADTPEHSAICEEECMVEYGFGGVEKGQKESLIKEIELPASLLSSNSENCRNIKVSYELEVEAKIKRRKEVLKLSLPIKVGTIPLNIEVHQFTHLSSSKSSTHFSSNID